MDQYAYDVAFSFLDSDGDLVRQIQDRMEGRFKFFDFRDHQPKLVGTDGHDTLSRVFEDEALTSLVLFRNGWGKRGFTVPELTGIRNRGHQQGYGFLLVVVADDHPELPTFFPRTAIWYGLRQYGLNGLIPVIDAHLKRNGGEPSEASVEGAMAAVKRAQVLEEARRQYLRVRVDPDGFRWVSEAMRFQEHLRDKARSIKDVPLQIEGHPGNVLCVTAPLFGRLNTSLRPAGDSWFMWCGFYAANDRNEQHQVAEMICWPDLDADHEPAWRVEERWLRTEALVERVLCKLAACMKR